MHPHRHRFGLWLIACCLAAGCGEPVDAVEQAADDRSGADRSTTTTIPGGGTTDADRVLTPDDLKGLPWRSVGPANMSGRVADIGVAPGNPKTFYVAFGTGGLFKTTNNGTTLTPVMDEAETASIGSVVVCDAPADWSGWEEEEEQTDPDKREKAGKAKIVWVGTGEGNGRNSSSWGHGVYRSTDGGATFDNVGLIETHDIPRLAVDPRNPDDCYVAAMGHLWGPNAERGIYKTSDGGKIWSAVLQIDEDTGAIDVMIDPRAPDTVYAAMYTRRRTAWSFRSGGPNGGIYRSDNAGETWTKLTSGLPQQTGRIGMDLYRKDPRIVYAIIESDVGGSGVSAFDGRSKSGGVFRSEDRGDTWTRMDQRIPRAFYFSKIRIDPNDDQRVYRLGWGLDVSDDGGKTWRAGGARKPHVDMHAMFIDPDDSDHIYLGTDGGIYLTFDRGKTWDFLNHLAVGEFYNVAVDMSDPYRIGGGLQDNGSWIGPSATIWFARGEDAFGPRTGSGYGISNHDWWFINNGDGFHVAFDPADSNIVFAESQGGELVRIHLDTGVRKRLIPSPKEGQPRFRFNWNSPFFISTHDPKTLYLAGNYVFKMTERGETWRRISDDLTTDDIEKIESVGSDAETHCAIVSLAESPLAAGLIWAGSDDGLIHVTTDDGATWSDVTPVEVVGMYVSKIDPSHHERDTAYVAIDGHRSDDFKPRVLMTTDAGQSWQSIAGDLPDGHTVKVVREDHFNPNVLYVGTERAAFVSIDRGRHWVKMNGKSLPTVAVDDLVQHPRETDLIAGTHGRSIYVLDDASPLSGLSPEIVQSEFHLFDVRPAKPVLYLDYQGFWGDRMFKAKNPPLGARITYWIRDYTDEEITLTINDANDALVRKLTGTNRPGLNRVVWDLQREKHDQFDNPDSWLGQTHFVPAGDYTVNVSYGKRKAKGTITVLPAPGSES